MPVRHLLLVQNYCGVLEFVKEELGPKGIPDVSLGCSASAGGKLKCHLEYQKVMNSGLKERSERAISLSPHHGDK